LQVEEKGIVELVHQFFRAYGREEELLMWAIKHEIEVTGAPHRASAH